MPNTAIIIWFTNSRSVHLEKYETLAKMTLIKKKINKCAALAYNSF